VTECPNFAAPAQRNLANQTGVAGSKLSQAATRPRGRASVKIRDVMTPDVEVVTPDDTLKTAVQLMADLDCDALPVSEDDHLIGVITGRDIAAEIVTKNQGGDKIRVREAMSPDVLYCFENEPINTVARKMSDWWVRRLPVVKPNRRLIGTVSLADIAALEAPHKRRTRRGRRVAVAA
jgi:CBS domain-containing protein